MSEAPRTQPARAAVVAALLSLGALYFSTASRFITGGDTGEFATLYAVGGVPHPSGYPLYLAWLRLARATHLLDGVSPAQGASRATSLLATLAAAALYNAARAWGAGRPAALVAAGVYALSPLAWQLATQPEVFALNSLVAGLVLFASAPGAPVRGARRAGLLGLLAGLGLAAHLSSVLLAPVGIYGLATAAREERSWPRALGAALPAALLGLAPFALLLYEARRAGDLLRWGDLRTLADLLRHATRGDYGSASLSAGGRAADPAATLRHMLPVLFSQAHFAWPFALWGLARARAGGPSRWARAALAATIVLAGPLFYARFNIPVAGVGAAVIERFALLPSALVVPAAALGLEALYERARGRRRALSLVTAGFAAMLFASALRSRAIVRANATPEVENYLRDLLASCEPRAVLLATGDHRTLGLPYLQLALGVRRDVLALDPKLLLHAWYRARMAALLGAPLPSPGGRTGRSVDTVALARAALAVGRPVQLADVFSPAIVRELPSYPVGLTIRVAAPGGALPAPAGLFALNEALYRSFANAPSPVPSGPWQLETRDDYARGWASLAAAFGRAGLEPEAQRAAAYARAWSR